MRFDFPLIRTAAPRWLAAAAIALLLLLAGCQRVQEEITAAQNPYPDSSPLHAPFDRMVRTLANDPRYVERMRGAGSQDAALKLGFALAMDGLRRLDDRTLVKRLELLSALMDNADEPSCTLLARPDPADPAAASQAVMAGLEKLPAAQIDAWFDFSLRATQASLDNVPAGAADPAQTRLALEALLQRLPQSQQPRMTAALVAPMQATPGDACWAGRTLYREILRMPAPQRSVLARALASPQ